jgi:hypothetical protein
MSDHARLAEQINAAHAACHEAERSALGHALHAGELLLDVKQRVGHGAFLAWCEAHCRFTPRLGQMYMSLAHAVRTGRLNAKHVSHLTLREALALVREPTERPFWLRPVKEYVVPVAFATAADHGRFWQLLKELHAAGDPAPTLVAALECYVESQTFLGESA